MAFITPAVLAVFGYVIMRKFVFDLVDEVWDAGDELVVRNRNQEERIPLSDVINVSYAPFQNPPRVTLTLRRPCRFGKEVAFSAPISLNPFSRSPIVDELIERIDAERRGKEDVPDSGEQ